MKLANALTITLMLLAPPFAAQAQGNAPAAPNSNAITNAPARQQPVPAPDLTAPAGIGLPHVCWQDMFYPLLEIRLGIQGSVDLSYVVTADGSTKDLAVAKTSGDDELDQAALSCVAAFRYRPAMKNGVAIDFPWKSRVIWKISDTTTPLPVLSAASPRSCPLERQDSSRAAPPYPVTLIVKTGSDGTVTGEDIAESSGDDIFDNYVLDCVKHWTYDPPLVNGAPVASQTVAIVTWLGQPLRPDPQPAPIGNAGACNDRPEQAAAAASKPIVGFTVELNGSVDSASIRRSSGDPDYDDYVLSCVRRWSYRPGTHLGRPAVVHMRVQIG
ncbi:MAG: TonB family protein [Rhizomicrobium sp.]